MILMDTQQPFETLDPENWDEMRELAHRMVDDMLDYMRTVRMRPVWRHASADVKAHFSEPLPLDPQPLKQVYEEFLEYVLPYPLGNTHPRFWGWVAGTGTVSGALAELLAGVTYGRRVHDRQHLIEMLFEESVEEDLLTLLNGTQVLILVDVGWRLDKPLVDAVDLLIESAAAVALALAWEHLLVPLASPEEQAARKKKADSVKAEMDQIKKAKTDGLSEDDQKFWEGAVQELTDASIVRLESASTPISHGIPAVSRACWTGRLKKQPYS